MLGLNLRTLQVFVQDTYGPSVWEDVALQAELPEPDFESMLEYDESVYFSVLAAAAKVLDKPIEAFLEDVGTYLVSHTNSEPLRRLLRFGGVDYIEFLHSLDDLPERAKLAVADLTLPVLELDEHSHNQFHLKVGQGHPGFSHVLVGLLRAMADDYGALVLLDYDGSYRNMQVIEIALVESAYAQGRDFDLSASRTNGAKS